MEEIIKKIEKLLALAEKNPNENEAMAAAAKAQEMIAKYNIDIANIGSSEKKPEIGTSTHTIPANYHYNRKWRYDLALIISRNFRCKVYVLGRDHVVFYGFKNDTKAALSVFSFLFTVGNKLAVKYYNEYKKSHWDTHGVLNMYLRGFCQGVADILDEQCQALMIVTPKEVEDAWVEKSKSFRGSVNASVKVNGDREAYNNGRQDGRTTMQSKQLKA